MQPLIGVSNFAVKTFSVKFTTLSETQGKHKPPSHRTQPVNQTVSRYDVIWQHFFL